MMKWERVEQCTLKFFRLHRNLETLLFFLKLSLLHQQPSLLFTNNHYYVYYWLHVPDSAVKNNCCVSVFLRGTTWDTTVLYHESAQNWEMMQKYSTIFLNLTNYMDHLFNFMQISKMFKILYLKWPQLQKLTKLPK